MICARAMLAALLGLAISMPAGAQTPEPGSRPRATPSGEGRRAVEAALNRLGRAEAELAKVDAEQTALEAEILDLKQSGASRGRLEGRLRDSVAAEDDLRASLELVDAARDALRRTIRTEVRAIDQTLRRRAEGLRTGPEANRRKTAAEIRALLDTRNWMLRQQRRAQPPETALPAGAELAQLRIDPLDGPDELREKADFAEDARDKLKAKQARLRRLVERRRRTRDIARAARDFAVDVSLFDEEVRTAASRTSGAAAAGNGNTEGRVSTDQGASDGAGAPALPAQPGSGAEDGLDGSGGLESPAPGPDVPPNFQMGDGAGGGGNEGAGGDPAGGGPSPDLGGAADLTASSSGGTDPLVLLGLKIDRLAETADVEALEELLQEYARLEALFSARARAMRAQARRLDDAPPDE